MADVIASLEPGTRLLDRYIIKRRIGYTAMSVLYQARDEVQALDVCLKFPPPAVASDKRSTEFIKSEFDHTVRLNHDNIVKTFKFEVTDGRPFFVMEFIDGRNLESVLVDNERANHPDGAANEAASHHVGLPYNTIFRYAQQISMALQEAHRLKIVHRDLKPSNVIVAPDDHLKVVDFGIARVVKDTFTRLTNESTSGTLIYMAPEQLSGKERKLGPASDWYSFGAILYEMIRGRPPFATGDVTYQHLHVAPEPLTEFRPDCPPLLEQLTMRMLEKDPQIRNANITSFVEAIEALSTQNAEAMNVIGPALTGPVPNARPARGGGHPIPTRVLYGVIALFLATTAVAVSAYTDASRKLRTATERAQGTSMQVTAAGKQIRDTDSMYVQTRNSLTDTEQQLQTRTGELDQVNAEKSSIENRLDHTQAELSESERNSAELEEQVESREQTITQLRSRIQDQANRLATQQASLNDLQRTNNNLSNENSALRSNASALENESNAWMNQANSNAAQFEDCRQQYNRLWCTYNPCR